MKIKIKVKTNSKKEKVEKISDNEFTVSVKERPVDGRANSSVVSVLSKHLKIPESLIKIKSGLRSNIKIIEIKL